MKLAFFTDTYLPNVDGVVRTVVDMRRELEREGHDVYIFTSGTSRDKQFNPDPHVFFHRSFRFPLYPQYKIALFPYVSAVNNARKSGVEMVHSHAMASMGLAAISTAKTLHVPLVGTFHTLLPKAVDLISWGPTSSKAASKVLWSAFEWFYRPFDVVTAPSATIGNLLKEHDLPNVTVIPNGVDIKRFSPDASDGLRMRKKLGLGEKQPLVVVAGRLSPEKNVPVIVEAAKIVRQESPLVQFISTGDGPARREVEKHVKALRLQDTVRLTGFLPESQIASLYRAADVLATASTFETQGLSALEALSCGTPVVAANAMALPETVKHGVNGYLFSAGDARECAAHLVKVLSSDASARRQMMQRAVQSAEPYSLPKVTQKWVQLYQSLL